MSDNLQETYKSLLEHYGNKYVDFDLFFQNHEGLFVFSRLDIVFNVLTKLLDQQIIFKDQIFLECGSGDGRIVALASIIGMEAYGLELSKDMNEIAEKHMLKLKEEGIITPLPKVKQGDFLKAESYDKINCSVTKIDIFFNYYTNTELLANMVSKLGKRGCIMISISLSKRPVKCDLELIISSPLKDRNHYLFVYKKS